MMEFFALALKSSFGAYPVTIFIKLCKGLGVIQAYYYHISKERLEFFHIYVLVFNGVKAIRNSIRWCTHTGIGNNNNK